MPFLLAEILNFQGSTHRIGVGSFSYIDICVRAAVSYERPDSCQPLIARQTIKLFIGFRENQSVCVIF